MKITTESGATYEIIDGLCYKTDHFGIGYPPFKIWIMKSVGPEIQTLNELLDSADSPPEIGKRMYVAGKDEWWISTKIVNIEDES